MRKIQPNLGQESVWDYPRPPRLEPFKQHIRIEHNGLLVHTNAAWRVLETSHPPTYYIPIQDVQLHKLKPVPNKSSFCEWKGSAEYWAIMNTSLIVAWSYPNPNKSFISIKGYLAFYPSKVDCYIGDEKVVAQEGDFYGGWITKNIVGPFKGGKGTWGW